MGFSERQRSESAFSPFEESEMRKIKHRSTWLRENSPASGGKQERKRLALERGEGRQERRRHHVRQTRNSFSETLGRENDLGFRWLLE
ncbi:hypothetical protein TNCV_1922331 [Trichonephila clavipes]|nr:hypothetical protein TNCV_1922331 [Trichonephila clavipes]